jgi:tetratricopeptide (TPR) repeat protein/DNA-binding XRE family transcriptional regulator
MKMDDIRDASFGDLLKVFRKRLKLKQCNLAEKLDIHRNTIGTWERGEYLPESKGLVLELARQLHLNEYETRQLLEASLTALSPHWNVPYPRNPFFTGREELLQQLHQGLFHKEVITLTRSYTLSGLGGIGKTQTAIEYSYRYANDYTAIFWIRAETSESIISSFLTIAQIINLPEKQEQDQSRVVAAVTSWLTNHGKWLLIFDNVEEIELVKGFLPSARSGSLLFTSRIHALGLSTHTLNLQPMTLEEGIHFLLNRSRLNNPMSRLECPEPDKEAAAREIGEIMDGLPLAIDQAGAYIEAVQCSLSDYLQLFRTSQGSRLLDERDIYADHPLSVTRTFTLAFEQLERSNILAADFLAVCAFLSSEAIPESLFIEGASLLGPGFVRMAGDPFTFNDAIKTLLRYSLLQRDAATHTITIHRLVQAVLREYLAREKRYIWKGRVLQMMCKLFPSEFTHPHYMRGCEQLLPHALACITLHVQEKTNETQLVTLMSHIATYLANRARFTEAERLFQQALHLGEQELGVEHLLTAEVLLRLATFYGIQGKYQQAEPLCERALRIREHALGHEHLLVAEALYNLAIPCSRQGKYQQAEDLFQQVLRIREHALGHEHLLVAEALHGLSVFYILQGEYQQAEHLCERALHIREQILGKNHPLLAPSLYNLATVYTHQKEYEQAELLYQRALQIWETIGPEHADVAYALQGLVKLYTAREQFKLAESLCKRALHIRERALGNDHFRVATSLYDLANIYTNQKMYTQAEPLYLQSLQIARKALGSEHPEVARLLTGLAALHCKQGKYEQARPLYEHALALRQRLLRPGHPDIAESLHSLASFYQTQ